MGRLVPTGTDIDRETLLDITVNLIPMGILVFFVVLFLVFTPFPPNLFIAGVSHFLTIFPLVLLALLTYVAAKVIARDEKKLEERSNEGQGLEARSTAGEEQAPATGGEGQSGSSVSDGQVDESRSATDGTTADSAPDARSDDDTVESAVTPADDGGEPASTDGPDAEATDDSAADERSGDESERSTDE
ncbi:DUF6684 family protein [Halomarina salina]|uniref:DUF6684 family protein n=1 Tax=Halomarina salina TaxID=1872699 RepID=A0ABD5RL49_9EURY|nr:DUF6684 family protein [Halomarina salina]